jgi:FkbM family methyltransferase
VKAPLTTISTLVSQELARGADVGGLYSNTHLLHRYRRWRGINVDLDERAVERFRQARPDDVNLHLAVSDREEDVEVIRFKDGAVNTLDPVAAQRLEGKFERDGRRRMRTVTLASILAEHLRPDERVDLLSIDVEGVEERVLRGHDWERYPPEFLLVERHGLALGKVQEDETHRFVGGLGYALLSHAFVTSIYRRA